MVPWTRHTENKGQLLVWYEFIWNPTQQKQKQYCFCGPKKNQKQQKTRFTAYPPTNLVGPKKSLVACLGSPELNVGNHWIDEKWRARSILWLHPQLHDSLILWVMVGFSSLPVVIYALIKYAWICVYAHVCVSTHAHMWRTEVNWSHVPCFGTVPLSETPDSLMGLSRLVSKSQGPFQLHFPSAEITNSTTMPGFSMWIPRIKPQPSCLCGKCFVD